MTQFKGIKQVTLAFYKGMADVDKSGYLFLVRNGEYNEDGTIKGNPTSEEIYFGTRKYGDTSHRFISNIFEAFGGLLDSEGGFILPVGKDFVSFDDSNAKNLSDILYALDAAIKANADKFAGYYTKSEVDALLLSIEDAIDTCLTGVSVKVGDATYDGEVIEGVATVDLPDAFEAAGKVKNVTVDGVSVMDGTTAKIDLSGKANVSDITALDGRLDILEAIKHAADVVYDPQTKYINLKDSEGNVLGTGFDATPFIVDGMLNDVDFVKDTDGNATSTLRFTFNADGKEKTIDVNFAEYVDVYHADNTSIELNSKTNTFSVKEVDATKTKLGTDIQIAGGPLANNVVDSVDVWPTGWTDASGNKIIPAGQSMEQILTALFLKVVEGNVTWDAKATWSPSLGKPVPVLTTGPVEVGATVKVTKLTAGTATAGTRTAKCSCTQGHFLADENGEPTGSHVAGNKSLSATGSIEGTASYAWTWNGTAVDVTVNSTELTCSNEGANKIKVTQSGQTAVVDTLPTTKVFAATNTKTVLSDKSATFTDDTSKTPTSVALSKTSDEVSVNAYYRIYTNGKQGSNGVASSETALVADDATKLNLVADGTAFFVNFAPMIDGGTGYRLLVKSGKTITQAMALNTLNSKYEVDMKSQFVKASASVKKLCGGVEIDYDVYEAKGSAGANAIQFKID